MIYIDSPLHFLEVHPRDHVESPFQMLEHVMVNNLIHVHRPVDSHIAVHLVVQVWEFLQERRLN